MRAVLAAPGLASALSPRVSPVQDRGEDPVRKWPRSRATILARPSRPSLVPDFGVPRRSAEGSLINFETAPFPYHGTVPGSEQPFLNAGTEGHWGHVNFRGDVLGESQIFSDDRVLLHIPPGFDPKRPAVMVVFFHGHGAEFSPKMYTTASRCRRRLRPPE